LDLSECERELIHLPGRIQPHGILIGADAETLRVSHVSANCERLLGKPPAAALGAPLQTLLGSAWSSDVERSLRQASALIGAVSLDFPERRLVCSYHRSAGSLLLEVEDDVFASDAALGRKRAVEPTLNAIAALQAADDVQSLCQQAVEHLRHMTGYDRVMAYRFDESWNGTVIAEARADHLQPYLGLHYPASDIPSQARELYLKKRMRLIPDARYAPVPLLTEADAGPLDLSLATLRAVSPYHLEYLANMGVRATLVLSLLVRGRLWGLMACHHGKPRYLPYDQQGQSEVFAQVLANLILAREETDASNRRLDLQEFFEHLVDAASESTGPIAERLEEEDAALLGVLAADGAAIVCDGRTCRVGKTPTDAELAELVTWLDTRTQSAEGGFSSERPWFTDRLGELFPPAEAYRAVASGLVALPLFDSPGEYLLWFRVEAERTVTWAGDPTKPALLEDGKLSPRKSFEAWREVVRGRSRPWNRLELEIAQGLRWLKDIAQRSRLAHRSAMLDEVRRAFRDDLVAELAVLEAELPRLLVGAGPEAQAGVERLTRARARVARLLADTED
jgi:light-regulated signal transduction histidine kinase (bacteriophytochrome)